MKLWNGHRWFEHPTKPLSIETIEEATEMLLAGVVLKEGPGSTETFVEDLEQTMLSLCPGVEYDEEDHGKGLPNE